MSFVLSRYFKLGQTKDGLMFPLFRRSNVNFEYFGEMDDECKIYRFIPIFEFGESVLFERPLMEKTCSEGDSYPIAFHFDKNIKEISFQEARELLASETLSAENVGPISWMQLISALGLGSGFQRLAAGSFAKTYLSQEDQSYFIGGHTVFHQKRKYIWSNINNKENAKSHFHTDIDNVKIRNTFEVESLFIELQDFYGKTERFNDVWYFLSEFTGQTERLYEVGVDFFCGRELSEIINEKYGEYFISRMMQIGMSINRSDDFCDKMYDEYETGSIFNYSERIGEDLVFSYFSWLVWSGTGAENRISGAFGPVKNCRFRAETFVKYAVFTIRIAQSEGDGFQRYALSAFRSLLAKRAYVDILKQDEAASKLISQIERLVRQYRDRLRD